MLVVFMRRNILSMVNIKPFRIATDYWSNMVPMETRLGDPPKADDKNVLSGKATMAQIKLETNNWSGTSPFLFPNNSLLWQNICNCILILPHHIHVSFE